MNDKTQVTAIIMASGLSKRMGTDKLKLPLRGKQLYQHIIDTVEDLPLKEKIVVTSKEYIKTYAEKKGFIVVLNNEAEKGQSVSILKGLKETSVSDGYMFFVADQPFLKRETIICIIEKFKEHTSKIVIPFFNGEKGNPVIFPHRLKEDLMQIKGDQGGSVVIKKEWENSIKINFKDSLEGLDIDTMENYYKYKEN